MTVDVFLLNTMTQAQIGLQKQLEQATPADRTTRPLNDSPVLYIETSEQTPPTFLEQMEHTKVEHENPKTLLHMMILIIHKQHHLLQKSDMRS